VIYNITVITPVQRKGFGINANDVIPTVPTNGRAVSVNGRAVSVNGRAVSVNGRAVSVNGRAVRPFLNLSNTHRTGTV